MIKSQDFVVAFNHAMRYEVGAFWNPADPDVIAGSIGTREQGRKVGYVNIPADRGGETKFGVAQNANPTVNVRNLTLDQAEDVYFYSYWLRGQCDKLPPALTIAHFDACVNHGIGRASKFLQQALGVTVDGQIGLGTISAAQAANQTDLIKKISRIRSDFYQAIVDRDPSQSIFLNGWMRRVTEVTDFTLQSLK